MTSSPAWSAGTAADVDKAVKAARRARVEPWAQPWYAAERGRLMYELSDLVDAAMAELAALESLNSAKPSTTPWVISKESSIPCDTMPAGPTKIEEDPPVRGSFLSYTLRQPVGVVGQIIPWNFPLLMLAWKWGPALACGNTVVMKPAEQTPLTATGSPS